MRSFNLRWQQRSVNRAIGAFVFLSCDYPTRNRECRRAKSFWKQLWAALFEERLKHSAAFAQFFQTYSISYHEGDKIPHLERVSGQPDLLNDLLTPLTR